MCPQVLVCFSQVFFPFAILFTNLMLLREKSPPCIPSPRGRNRIQLSHKNSNAPKKIDLTSRKSNFCRTRPVMLVARLTRLGSIGIRSIGRECWFLFFWLCAQIQIKDNIINYNFIHVIDDKIYIIICSVCLYVI